MAVRVLETRVAPGSVSAGGLALARQFVSRERRGRRSGPQLRQGERPPTTSNLGPGPYIIGPGAAAEL